MNDTLTKARRLLKERLDSLKKDVQFCIFKTDDNPNWPAPFPTLLYCFSVIDLMGTLYWKCTIGSKQSQKKCEESIEGGITNKALNYMIDFMKYPTLDAELIQKVFRHKIVHLAQPLPKKKLYELTYTWRYYHNDRSKHLVTEDSNRSDNLKVFSISIWSLVEDLEDSIFAPNGYMQSLSEDSEKGQELRDKFNKVFQEAFELAL